MSEAGTRAASKPRKIVALLIETSNDYARGLLHGIVAYMREHRPWSTYLAEHRRGDQPPEWLKSWKGDGIIARIENRKIASAVIATGLPVVDVSAANLVPSVPWVETDDRAIGRAAYEHLVERGFKNLAYCGNSRYNWSKWREDAFAECVRASGREVRTFDVNEDSSDEPDWSHQLKRLAQWIRHLPRPVGIMACFDLVGRQVLEACRQAEIPVPDEVAVVGVDNDELICELAYPPMSSVAPDTHRTGYMAARILDDLMSGKKNVSRDNRIEPIGVIVRESSDVLAIEDGDVTAAVRFIREHACSGIDVGDVMQHVSLSRRVLEARFKKLIGRTPHEEIDRVQLNRVKELLRETDLPLTEIARRSGYEHVEYLSVVFKKKFGVPPSEFRAKSRR
jgi:LacI family transcriptional regulator